MADIHQIPMYTLPNKPSYATIAKTGVTMKTMNMRIGLKKQPPRGFGTLAKLPVEIRLQIWFELERLCCPLGRPRDKRWSISTLWHVSNPIRKECQAIFVDDRRLTLDLSSYEARPGHWPSEFPIHDQYGNRWSVSPQFDRRTCTFERGKELEDLTHVTLMKNLKREKGIVIRIVLAAPQDAGELLQAYNRVRWVAEYLQLCNPRKLHIDLRDTSERSWTTGFSAEWVDHLGNEYRHPLIFVLWSIRRWVDCAAITAIVSNARNTNYHKACLKRMRGLAKDNADMGLAVKLRCRHWLSHILDEVDTPSAGMLRLEQMATVDARKDPVFRCWGCLDRRDASSAWAPRKRNHILSTIHIQKGQWTPKHPIAGGLRPLFEQLTDSMERNGPLYGRYHGMDLHRSCSSRREILANFDGVDQKVRLEAEQELEAAFRFDYSTININFWQGPGKVNQLERYWKSLDHWVTEHPGGIPHRNQPAHQEVLCDFRDRHVMHPPELCSCKREAWAGCPLGGMCQLPLKLQDDGYDSDTDSDCGVEY